MDQAQSNQTEIAAMRSLQLNKEQIAAYFNQHCLALQANQLNDNLINHQLTIAQQQVNPQQISQQLNQQLSHQLNHQLSQQINHLNSKMNRHSPNQQIKPILIQNPDQLDKTKLKASGFSLYNVTDQQAPNDTQLNYPSSGSNKQLLNKVSHMQPSVIRSPSAFKPVARRKDSIYSMEGLDTKRLIKEQQFVDLLNKVRDNDFSESSQRVKSPKKNYIDRMQKLNDQSNQTKSYTPTRHLSLEPQFKNNNLLTNQFSPPLKHLTNHNNISSLNHRSLKNSFDHLTNLRISPLTYSSMHEDDDQLPLDMSKPGKTKADHHSSTDDPLNKKSKLMKEADIGQYINKIIAENSAIIETNEIKLPKRTIARNSTSNLPTATQFKGKNQLQRMNRSVSVIQSPASDGQLLAHLTYSEIFNQERLNHDSPKLVSALRGQLENIQTNSDSSNSLKMLANQKPVVPSVNLENNEFLTSPLYSFYQNQQITNAKFNRRLPDENYNIHNSSDKLDNTLENSLMKKFLKTKAPTIKVTPPSGSQGEETDCRLDHCSKSSIIKDLLLVNKDGPNNSDQNQVQKDAQHDGEDRQKSDQEELSCLVYVCTICKIAFRNKETLAAHQTHYCKNNLSAQQSNKDLYSEVNKLTGINEIREAKTKDALGNILKQHLLHSSTLPKKRKISEPTFPVSSSQLNTHSLFAKEMQASLKSNSVEESSKENVTTNDSVYFSNFGSEAQNVARKISVLTAANRPYFIHIKQPVFEHQHLIDLRQIPGLPAQLNNQQFYKNEFNTNSLKSEHNNSVTNLTNLDHQTYVAQSPIGHTSNPSAHSPTPSEVNKNSANSSHKHIDKLKDYMLITEYLPHYDQKITIKGQLMFDILAKTLEEQGDEAEFRQSAYEDNCTVTNKFIINNRVDQISSMPVFVGNINQQVNDTSISSTDQTYEKNFKSKESRNTVEIDEKRPTEEREDDVSEKSLKIDEDQQDKPTKQTIEINGTTLTKRPANLFNCLPKKPYQLTCSNLVSPETPRSEKTFVQCNLNGKIYTLLKPKRTTRVTFCCIYTPQPCFIQSTEPKLSMYSNWQIFPPYESILNEYTAPLLMKCYDSRQWQHRLYQYTSKFFIKLPEIVEIELNESSNEKDEYDLNDRSLHDLYLKRLREVDSENGCTLLPTYNWMVKKMKQDRINIRFKLREFKKKFCEESSDLTDRLLKRRQRKISRKISDEYSSSQPDARQLVGRKPSCINQPQRIFLFDGGYKSNEEYTYVRGRGRGKYVCTECGIRCKKPSMLRKHIRSHTNLRPYSCSYCTFAFKTKGNLTKHMKSKAHHKKCAELGINPIPTSIDSHTQIDTKALALQEAMERATNSSSYLSDAYSDVNDLEMEDEDSELDDQLDDDQLDEKWGIDEDDDLEEEDEEYLRRLNCGDQHLHITGLRLISNNFNLNQIDQQLGHDTINNYLDVDIGCLTNYKRLSAFKDIILPNSNSINSAGTDILNKFSIITDVFNSTKTTTNSHQDKAIIKSVEECKPTGLEIVSESSGESTSSQLVGKHNDSSSLISVLDCNNNLVTLSRTNRLTGDESIQSNTIRHKQSLIGGVNSNSLASIPECFEEESRKDDEQGSSGRKDNEERSEDSIEKLIADRNDLEPFEISDIPGNKFIEKLDHRLSDKTNQAINLDLDGNYKLSKLVSSSSELKRKNVELSSTDEVTIWKRFKNDCNECSDDDGFNRSETITPDKINESTTHEKSTTPPTITTSDVPKKNNSRETFTTGIKLDVRSEDRKVDRMDESSGSNQETPKDNSTLQETMTKLIDFNQLSKDSIPKVNLDHKCNSRSKSLPPQKINENLHQSESRSNSVNSNLNVSEIDEHEVAHSLLSLSRNWTSDVEMKSIQHSNQIILPIKRKISQEFGLVPYHHGNYSQLDSSRIKSALTTYSDEEVSRAFKRNNVKNEKNCSNEDWKLTDRLKDEISRKFSEKGGLNVDELTSSKSNSGGKLSEKLAEIKRKSSESQMMSKRLNENEDIQKLLQKVDSNTVKTERPNDLDPKKLISIHIQNTIDRHERILNHGTLELSPTSTALSSPSTSNKQPVDNCRTNLCRICNKTFSEESDLKLHEHIHYFFERPFRCEVCSVSFRSTGHLQKHIRSVSHQNKLNMNSTFGQASRDNPRPFKCGDCKTSFRIFGHLSKHLRSKIHIGKLEGLGKLPPGLYSLMERNRIQLNDLDTTDCETSLLSLRKLAQRLQANGDLPMNSTIENYSSASQSSFVCSSVFCESSNDSNLSSSKPNDDKQLGVSYPSIAYLGENSSSNPSNLPVSNAFSSDQYSKMVTKNTLDHSLVTNTVTNATQLGPISLYNNVLEPIDHKLKPVRLIPSHLIDNLAIFTGGRYIPQQQFYDQTSCKHPHHLYPTNEKNIDLKPLSHGHPLPRPQATKPESPEIDVLEDSSESSRSSPKMEECVKKCVDKNESDGLKFDKTVPSPLVTSPTINKTTSPDFSSIKMSSNTCTICSMVFKSAKFLQVHLYSEHSDDSNKEDEQTKESSDLCCRICSRSFDSLDEFRKHALVHSMPRPFICDSCDAGFSTREFLNLHLKTHSSFNVPSQASFTG